MTRIREVWYFPAPFEGIQCQKLYTSDKQKTFAIFFPLKTKGVKRGEFWVRGTIGFCNGDRKVELEKIADKLDKELIVERVEKN